MSRYYFDVENGGLTVDEEGTELDGGEAVATLALRTLLDIARYEVVAHNERQMSVTARDATGVPVYRTELTVRAGWLVGHPG
ncbi:hypothetical protein ASG52_15390 [Methylobacterium sp. Leaf456]|uniref:DUF6894 family protein n=1 Tax=Methylobacterium sp. Leaf456 TaxID=1736382 RepID=UPI0007020456|nr:hypothetical protein [Methylobacterium sp. Leaf456]KQT45536.1 hypothetical protein ASG52_15390 [Methylobacterium sp. Leaf456]